MESVVRLALERMEDIFILRQSGRQVAAALGCDEADQVRFATALSELGREVVSHRRRTSAAISIDSDGSLVVEIEKFPDLRKSNGVALSGLDAARRLVGELSERPGRDGNTVIMRLKRASPARIGPNASALREMLQKSRPLAPLDELRAENRDLISTLDVLRVKQTELERLNTELEETNRGVMAMYAHLEDELEETNRGVVALYAELDEKTRQLNDANEAKTRFLANVSHELRSPVTSVLGLTRLLLDPESAPLAEDQLKQLTLITHSAGELLGLVNDLLDLAKAESGRLEPDVSSVDLAEVFTDLRGALRPMTGDDVKLIVELDNVPAIETDRTLLTQVLRNLLTNALKFTPSGSVTLRARAVSTHRIEVAVADTGIGIALEDQARIFEEFYQVRGPLQLRQKGTGLGLPYALRVVRALGADLELESEPGVGSVFRVTLPVLWQSLLSAERSPVASRVAVSVGTVLIVDDDESFRTTLRGLLQGCCRRVLEASGGNEGLEVMRRAAPDLVFIDLRMPDIDGASVVAQMKADPALRSIPAVIVTSTDLRTVPELESTTTLLSKTSLNRPSVLGIIEKLLG